MAEFEPFDKAMLDKKLRKAAFRNTCSELVAEHKVLRRSGSVNEASDFARLLEQAYQIGLAHGQTPDLERHQQ